MDSISSSGYHFQDISPLRNESSEHSPASVRGGERENVTVNDDMVLVGKSGQSTGLKRMDPASLKSMEAPAAPDIPAAPEAAQEIADIQPKAADDLPPYRFAMKYSVEEIMKSPEKARAFVNDYLSTEANYFAVARDEKSGLTYDGINLDIKTGKPLQIRDWSAPSKECLDMGICVKALSGDPRAALVVSKDDPSKAPEIAAGILKKKMDSYEEFYRENPGYGGFLPWFRVSEPVKPMPDWEAQIPALDNGEMVWSLLVAEQALKQSGYSEIAKQYSNYNEMLQQNAVKIFYDSAAGKLRGDVKVVNPQSADSSYETAPGKCDYLDGVHESSMLLLYVTLFGKELPEGASDKIWDKSAMKRVESKWGTTWEACWGSSHESWAHLFLPFRDNPDFDTLFRIREKIRTQNAAERGYPGLAASTNKPGSDGYLSDCGIEDIGSQPVTHNDVFAIYGAFPTLLQFAGNEPPNENYGLAWLLNMLQTQKMQGPLGGGESATNDGTKISPMKTIDGTLPNILAMTGGLAPETAEMLKSKGLYDRFMKIVEGELKEAMGTESLKEPVGFALPTVKVPTDNIPDYEFQGGSKSGGTEKKLASAVDPGFFITE
ncbi:MAG: hypothetical protein AB2L14_10930 [Candidatus Xenobiia bacterium LiM19]